MLSHLGRWATRGLEFAIVACLAIMAILVFGNVVLRYAFNSGIAESEELARLLFVWLIFMGAILASVQHAHIGVDTLVAKLPTVGKKILILATGALMLIACGIFIYGGWQQTVINLDNTYPVLGISYMWLYVVAVVFGIGMAIAIAYNIWDALTQKHTDKELILVAGTDADIADEINQATKRSDQEKL